MFFFLSKSFLCFALQCFFFASISVFLFLSTSISFYVSVYLLFCVSFFQYPCASICSFSPSMTFSLSFLCQSSTFLYLGTYLLKGKLPFAWTNLKLIAGVVWASQCDQIGRFIGLWATFQRLKQQLICPNLPILDNFLKVLKSIIFQVKSFSGNFYRPLAIFFWSHWSYNMKII